MHRHAILITATAAMGVAAASPAQAEEVTSLAHVETKGQGETTLVLIPGLNNDWRAWRSFMERNADRYTMHAVTLPGFGESDPPPMPEQDANQDDNDQQNKQNEKNEQNEGDGENVSPTPWLDNAVDAVAQFIEQEGLDSPVIVGHSLGGHLAYRLGMEHPDRVGKIIAIDGFPAFPLAPGGQAVPAEQRAQLVDQRVKPQLQQMSEEQWKRSQRRAVESIAAGTEHKDLLREMFTTPSKPAGVQYTLELLRSDLTSKMGELKTPALVIAAVNADQSPALNENQVKDMWRRQVRQAPNAKLVFFHETSHFVMLHRPEATDKTIAQFIAGEEPEGFAPQVRGEDDRRGGSGG